MHFQYSPSPYLPPQPKPDEEGKECEYCGGTIGLGEQGATLELGIVKRGPKSGLPMMGEDPLQAAPITLHRECIVDYVKAVVVDYQEEDDEPLCAICEQKIYGE